MSASGMSRVNLSRFSSNSPVISSPRRGTKQAPTHLSNGEAPPGHATPTSA